MNRAVVLPPRPEFTKDTNPIGLRRTLPVALVFSSVYETSVQPTAPCRVTKSVDDVLALVMKALYRDTADCGPGVTNNPVPVFEETKVLDNCTRPFC